jgi:hypothetical protein
MDDQTVRWHSHRDCRASITAVTVEVEGLFGNWPSQYSSCSLEDNAGIALSGIESRGEPYVAMD